MLILFFGHNVIIKIYSNNAFQCECSILLLPIYCMSYGVSETERYRFVRSGYAMVGQL